MKIKFNLFERVAGFFVLAAIGGAIAASVSVAYKKGWFSAKVPLYVTFPSADGLHVGTKVQISGLRAGSVTDIDLQSNNEVKVRFVVLKKFHNKIRKDSQVQLIRPFIIGEKVIEVSVGSVSQEIVRNEEVLAVKSSVDLMDLLSGRELGTYLESMGQLTENMRTLVEAFSDKQRFAALIETLDEINPLIKNLNKMSGRVVTLTDRLTAKRKVSRLVGNLAEATDQLKPHLPNLIEKSPQALANVAKSLDNLVLLSDELKKLLPALASVAPDLPKTGKRLVEAVDQAVITMKAIQKTFFIRGKVEEVKEEEAKMRLPAGEKK